MEIKLAKNAGFCFGVNRAVEMVYDLLEKGEKVSTLGPIIHNPQILAELAKKGVESVENPEDTKDEAVLVIRSHGVPKQVLTRAENSGVKYADATCPFVTKIHKIVENAGAQGRTVLIAGDTKHHEVRGIIGHCVGDSHVFDSEEMLEKLLSENENFAEKPITLVAQTTFNADLFANMQKKLKKACTNAEIFDTICGATINRQSEAKKLAREADVMLVVGGRFSSNSVKLFEICKGICPKTYFIETAKELSRDMFETADIVGVAAGASTPSGIIKEVVKTMSEILNEEKQAIVEGSDMAEQAEKAVVETKAEETASEPTKPEKTFEEMTFEEALEASLNGLNTDQKVRGVVLSVSPTEIQVDIGRKHTGYVTEDEFSFDPTVKLMDAVKVGDEMDLIVMRTNDQEGTVMLSKKKVDARLGWEKIELAQESEAIMNGVVTDINSGGVVAICEGCRVFIPASQATLTRGEDLNALKGKPVQFRILEIGRNRRVIGSIRSVARELRKGASEQFWKEVEVGKVYTGTVKSLTSYGAFVDLGGVDGMVHISELSWSRIKHPSEVVNVGDSVEVTVKAVDAENKKISLGFKKAGEDPWDILENQYPVGTTAKVTVVSMTPFGAFARIISGVDGLIHISQIANRRIDKPQDELSVGQEVEAKIIGIDFDKKRVSLSIRALLPEEEFAAAPVEAVEEVTETVVEETPVEVEPETVETTEAE